MPLTAIVSDQSRQEGEAPCESTLHARRQSACWAFSSRRPARARRCEAAVMNDSSMILRDAARSARVPDSNHTPFIRLVAHAISTAQKESSRTAGKNISAGALGKDFFNPVVRSANDLRVGLERLQGKKLAAGEAARSMAAAHFFSEALLPVSQPEDAADPIAHLLRSLDLGLVIHVAERANTRAKRWLSKGGRKKGTGRLAFDMFVMALLEASEQTGGRLTIYRTSHEVDRWAASLLRTVEQLRPLLPKTNFFPTGKLGYSLHTIYQRWRSEAEKSRRKKG